jgi:YidC/Oxa1 family membrane protein insertase
MLGFLGAGVSVAYHVVTDLDHFLAPLGGGLAAVVAIIAFTVAIRLLLVPLSYYALRGQAGQARLQPQVAELRRRYARQPERLQRELADLYQREGGTLLIGCLPLLIQLPFLSVMYRLFLSRSVGGQPNRLLARTVAGTPLGTRVFSLSWLDHGPAGHALGVSGLLGPSGLVFAGLITLLVLAGWASARLARRMSAGTTVAGASGPEAASRAVAALTRVVPYSTAVIALFVPLAAGIYLLTTTAWTAAERAALRRRAQAAADRSAAARARAAVS